MWEAISSPVGGWWDNIGKQPIKVNYQGSYHLESPSCICRGSLGSQSIMYLRESHCHYPSVRHPGPLRDSDNPWALQPVLWVGRVGSGS